MNRSVHCNPLGEWLDERGNILLSSVNLTELAQRPGVKTYSRYGFKQPTKAEVEKEFDRIAKEVFSKPEYNFYKKVTNLQRINNSRWRVYGGYKNGKPEVLLTTEFAHPKNDAAFWSNLYNKVNLLWGAKINDSWEYVEDNVLLKQIEVVWQIGYVVACSRLANKIEWLSKQTEEFWNSDGVNIL